MFMKNFLSEKICSILVITPKDSKLFDGSNKKATGKMKDEFGGVIST